MSTVYHASQRATKKTGEENSSPAVWSILLLVPAHHGWDGPRQHFSQNFFERNRVTASAARAIKLARAGQLALIKRNGVLVVVASHLHRESLEFKAVTLLSVSNGFFDLADHA